MSAARPSAAAAGLPKTSKRPLALRVLAIDVGGTHLKVLASGEREERKMVSGPRLTPAQLVKGVRAMTADWTFDAISMGYPGLVIHDRIALEPLNLGRGWVGFDFEKALGRPVKIMNDAAMQALGSYRRGRMLFLGLGTGLGSALIVDGGVQPMELAHLPYKKGRTFEEVVGVTGLARLGKHKWRKQVADVVAMLSAALEPDEIVLGGGNAKKLKTLPPATRLGDNANAFLGGFRIWEERRGKAESQP